MTYLTDTIKNLQEIEASLTMDNVDQYSEGVFLTFKDFYKENAELCACMDVIHNAYPSLQENGAKLQVIRSTIRAMLTQIDLKRDPKSCLSPSSYENAISAAFDNRKSQNIRMLNTILTLTATILASLLIIAPLVIIASFTVINPWVALLAIPFIVMTFASALLVMKSDSLRSGTYKFFNQTPVMEASDKLTKLMKTANHPILENGKEMYQRMYRTAWKNPLIPGDYDRLAYSNLSDKDITKKGLGVVRLEGFGIFYTREIYSDSQKGAPMNPPSCNK